MQSYVEHIAVPNLDITETWMKIAICIHKNGYNLLAAHRSKIADQSVSATWCLHMLNKRNGKLEPYATEQESALSEEQQSPRVLCRVKTEPPDQPHSPILLYTNISAPSGWKQVSHAQIWFSDIYDLNFSKNLNEVTFLAVLIWQPWIWNHGLIS